MTDKSAWQGQTWQDYNTRHLSAAIAWVRSLLEQRCGHHLPGAAAPPAKESRPSWRERLRRPPLMVPAPTFEVLMIADEASGDQSGPQAAPPPDGAAPPALPPPALVTLRQRLGLTRFEQDVLLLCVAMELDTSIAALCARAQHDPSRAYPTFALALTLFGEPTWDALSPERPLRHWRLIEINQPGGQPLTTSALRADEWVVNYLKGLGYLDDRLTPLLVPLPSPDGDDVPESQRLAAQTIVDALKQAVVSETLPVIQLVGADAASKHLVAGLACDALGLRAYRLATSLLPAAPPDLETFARLWQRASLLMPVALYLDTQGGEGEGPHAAPASAVNRLLARLNAMVILDTREPWPGLPPDAGSIEVAKPTPAEQRIAWEAALGEAAGDSPAALAGQFNLNLTAIREIARRAQAEEADEATLQVRLWDTCLAVTRPRLDAMAQLIEPKATWDDIVLAPADAALLRQIADQVGQRSKVYQDWGFDQKMSRGFGISALFAGESGTGKTMAAEVIANHLRLSLYRIDLSAVVSKYIGETEKNLRRLFDAAEDGGAILFFDEADALFGKRSEVKDSHDRYANIEVNYLLQRMESFGGLAILATNMKSALDPAFLRRLRFVVNFAFPGADERNVMWQKAFPPQTPTSGLDFTRLARLNLTGGHIALIALNAAFAAARAGSAVTMPIVLDAARAEFRKLERPINETDFRWPVGNVRAV